MWNVACTSAFRRKIKPYLPQAKTAKAEKWAKNIIIQFSKKEF